MARLALSFLAFHLLLFSASNVSSGTIQRAPLFLLGPVGPLNPFRSRLMLSGAIDKQMEPINEMTKQYQSQASGSTAKIETNDGKQLRSINDKYQDLLTSLGKEPDFQVQQFVKMSDALIKPAGISAKEISEAIAWQNSAQDAIARGQPPPAPPATLLEKIRSGGGFQSFGVRGDDRLDFPYDDASPAEQAVGYGPGEYSTGVRAVPMLDDSPAFRRRPELRGEYDVLVTASKDLAIRGEGYGLWGRKGRLEYIQAVEETEARWTDLMRKVDRGDLNPEFVRQARWYGGSLGAHSADAFQKLLRDCRELLRADAEKCSV